MEIKETYVDNVYADYIRCAFDDPEFQKKLEEIESRIDTFIRKNPGLSYLGVINNPPLRDWGSSDIPREIIEDDLKRILSLIINLSVEYQIPPEKIDMYTYRSTEDHLATTKRYSCIYHAGRKSFIVEIDPRIGREEFACIWNEINKNRKYTRKTDLIAKNQLLYAIHRARAQGSTYPEISEEITSGSLNHFEGKTYQCPDNINIRNIHFRFKKHLPKP
jgi:hypothetical protein